MIIIGKTSIPTAGAAGAAMSGCGEPAPVWMVIFTFFLLVICLFVSVLACISIWRDLFGGK